MSEITLRFADVCDAEALQRIYEPYVRDTAVSFEYDPPTVSEFESRIQHTLRRYPYLVALMDGEIVGYAYAGAFRPRKAYEHDAELSVYVERHHKKQGIGSRLYEGLEEILARQNVFTVHACITSADEPDGHLGADSEHFHAAMGFHLAARHERCGYKFGKWYHMIWMDKVIRPLPDKPEAFIPFEELLSPPTQG